MAFVRLVRMGEIRVPSEKLEYDHTVPLDLPRQEFIRPALEALHLTRRPAVCHLRRCGTLERNSEGKDPRTFEENSQGEGPSIFKDPVEKWRGQEKRKEEKWKRKRRRRLSKRRW